MTTLSSQHLKKFIAYCSNHGNAQVVCDYITLHFFLGLDIIDFKDLSVNNGNFDELDFIDSTIKNITITGCYIKKMKLDNAKFEKVHITNCIIENVEGILSYDKLPAVFDNCTVDNFKDAFTTSRIRELSITNGQKTLLAIIKKLFFQPGSGRQAGALLRGAEEYWDPDKAKEILRYMLTNQLIIKAPGAHGDLYIPKRKQSARMGKILELQTNCEDELWEIST